LLAVVVRLGVVEALVDIELLPVLLAVEQALKLHYHYV
jgi:hypothetical protein